MAEKQAGCLNINIKKPVSAKIIHLIKQTKTVMLLTTPIKNSSKMKCLARNFYMQSLSITSQNSFLVQFIFIGFPGKIDEKGRLVFTTNSNKGKSKDHQFDQRNVAYLNRTFEHVIQTLFIKDQMQFSNNWVLKRFRCFVLYSWKHLFNHSCRLNWIIHIWSNSPRLFMWIWSYLSNYSVWFNGKKLFIYVKLRSFMKKRHS